MGWIPFTIIIAIRLSTTKVILLSKVVEHTDLTVELLNGLGWCRQLGVVSRLRSTVHLQTQLLRFYIIIRSIWLRCEGLHSCQLCTLIRVGWNLLIWTLPGKEVVLFCLRWRFSYFFEMSSFVCGVSLQFFRLVEQHFISVNQFYLVEIDMR